MWNAPWPHDIKVAGTYYHSSLKTLRTFMVIIIIIIDLWGDKGHAWKTILHKFSNVSSTWDHPSCKTLWATRDIFHIANGVPEHINCEPSPKHTQLTLCHPAAWCVQCIPITCQKMRLIRCELQMACICVHGPRDGHSTTLKPTQQRLYIGHLWVRTKIIQYRNLTFRKIRWAVENDSEFFLTLKLWVSSWNLYFVIHDNINILFLSCHTVQYFVTRENTSNKFHLFLSFGHLYFVTRKNTKKF